MNRFSVLPIGFITTWTFTFVSPVEATGITRLHSQPSLVATNEAVFHNAPLWFKRTKAQRAIDRVQSRLEWTTRKVDVRFFTHASDFQKSHPLGPNAIAVTTNRKTGSEILLGPKVTRENFESVFGHELVHVIIFQKYGSAIPKWLEEGFANHIARPGQVDYQWLKSQPPIQSIAELSHPMVQDADSTRPLDSESIRRRYVASQALAELLNRRCSLENLVRLSVGRNLENYLQTMCQIQDLVTELNRWISTRK